MLVQSYGYFSRVRSLRSQLVMFSSRFLKERSQDIGPKSLRLQMASLKSLYKFGVELDYFSPMRTYNANYDTFAKRL